MLPSLARGKRVEQHSTGRRVSAIRAFYRGKTRRFRLSETFVTGAPLVALVGVGSAGVGVLCRTAVVPRGSLFPRSARYRVPRLFEVPLRPDPATLASNSPASSLLPRRRWTHDLCGSSATSAWLTRLAETCRKRFSRIAGAWNSLESRTTAEPRWWRCRRSASACRPPAGVRRRYPPSRGNSRWRSRRRRRRLSEELCWQRVTAISEWLYAKQVWENCWIIVITADIGIEELMV